MGTVLALLLGAAAAFFVLAMPIRMLETVTTLTRLSKLMVQAEPPISPNDRSLLSVLAGILTAGIGWVLVDSLIFGRAGISALIRTREDEYEEEGGDNYRPTDPLDLVVPTGGPDHDWAAPQGGDTRKPLSARTDIGDPPDISHLFGSSVPPTVGINQHLPPIAEILPGSGVTAPPLQPHVPQSAMQPPPLVPSEPKPSSPGSLTEPTSPAWPPLAPAHPAMQASAEPSRRDRSGGSAASPAVMPSWLPAPGGRREDGGADEGIEPVSVASPEETAPPLDEDMGVLTAPQPEPELQPIQILPHPTPPLMVQPPFSPFSQTLDAVEPPPPEKREPGMAGPAQGGAIRPSTSEVVATAVPPPPPEWGASTGPMPAPQPSLADPGFDRTRLEDLLGRLERGLEQRRARAVAQARSAAPLPEPKAALNATAPSTDRHEPPAGFAAPLSMPPAAAEPPTQSIFDAMPDQPRESITAQWTSETESGGATRGVPLPTAAKMDDDMLDQPLHVTLDRLRNMVRQ